MDGIYISEEENHLIGLTPKDECWICHELISNVNKKGMKRFISREYIFINDFSTHLQQILRREI